MKKLIVTTLVALTATAAVAAGTANIRKVNKVIKSVVESELTPLITKLELKFDERSKLESVDKLKVGAAITAVAKESAWSKKPTSVDVKAALKTVNSDPAHTKVQLAATLGSQTEALPLYSYVATQLLKDAQDDPNQDENDKAFIALLQEASATTKLDQIPAQLEKFIAIIKAEIAEDANDEDAAWTALINSLVVDTKIQNFKTTEVVLKTTKGAAFSFFDEMIVVSDLALNVSESGLSFSGAIAATTETSEVQEILAQVNAMLSAIENADAETLASLKDMASGYVHMAEEIVKGEQ